MRSNVLRLVEMPKCVRGGGEKPDAERKSRQFARAVMTAAVSGAMSSPVVRFRWSMHCAMDHRSGAGRQLVCASERPSTRESQCAVAERVSANVDSMSECIAVLIVGEGGSQSQRPIIAQQRVGNTSRTPRVDHSSRWIHSLHFHASCQFFEGRDRTRDFSQNVAP